MRTVAIVSQKGGSGKTTIAVHLAACGEQHRQRTVLIDLDPQGSAMGWKDRRSATGPDVVKATAAQLPRLLKEAEAAGVAFAVIDTAPHTTAAAATAVQHAGLTLIPC